jgi:hypothetical protein
MTTPRRGVEHYRAGPHLPNGTKPERSPGDRRVADWANGERVPRCMACSGPNPIDLRGVRGGVPGHFPVCDSCWFRVNPPDPLDATGIA